MRQNSIDLYPQQDMSLGYVANWVAPPRNLNIIGEDAWNAQGEFIEESRAFDRMPENNNYAGVVNVYLVRRYRAPTPGTVAGTLSLGSPTIVMGDDADGQTLAHEIGHAMGLDHSDVTFEVRPISGTLNNSTATEGKPQALFRHLMHSVTPGDWFNEEEAASMRFDAQVRPAFMQIDR